MANKAWDGIELLQVVESLSREKGLSKEAIFGALEETMKTVAKKQYGHIDSIIVKIDRNNGEVKVFNELLVISDEEMEALSTNRRTAEESSGEAAGDGTAEADPAASATNGVDKTAAMAAESGDESRPNAYPATDEAIANNQEADEEETELNSTSCIAISEAKQADPDVVLGDKVREHLPNLDLSRGIIQSAKSLLTLKILEIQREIEYKNCSHRINEIFSGIVTRVDRTGAYLQTNHGDAILKRDQMLRNDYFKVGDRIKACLIDVGTNPTGPQLIMSRACDQFLLQLLHAEIPEIYNKTIEVVGIAREPGSRAKIAVHSNDTSVDAVGSCIGIKGTRIKAVMAEIGNEKIDVINWANDHVQYVINCLHPIQAQKIFVDEERHTVEVIVDDVSLSSAIGRRGQNVRLISKLVGWTITINNEVTDSNRRLDDFNRSTLRLMNNLDIEEILAQLLVAESYDSAHKIADTTKEVLGLIEGIDEEIAEELISRAKEYTASNLADPVEETESRRRSASHITKPENMPREMMRALSFSGVKTIYDVAALSSEELVEILSKSEVDISDETARKIIINARQKAYFGYAANSTNM